MKKPFKKISTENWTTSLHSDGAFKNFKSIMEIGSQAIHAEGDTPELEIDLAVSMVTGEQNVRTRESNDTGPYYPQLFYKALGFHEYSCIDSDGASGALVMDLNEDIFAAGYCKQFDFVTNFGTTEHCFDQNNAFRNIHNLCKKNGIIMHELPFQGYLNHGLFNYQPNFFLDLARTNNYQVLGIYLNINHNIANLVTYSDKMMQYLHVPPNSTMSLVVVLRKNSEMDFCKPFDGKYMDCSKLNNYGVYQKLPKLYLPMDMPLDLSDLGESLSTSKLTKLLIKKIKRVSKSRVSSVWKKITLSG